MKRVLCLLLALVLCLSLFACGSAANEKDAEAEETKNTGSDIVGTWQCIKNMMPLHFKEDGTVDYVDYNEYFDVSWSYDSDAKNYTLTVTSKTEYLNGFAGVEFQPLETKTFSGFVIDNEDGIHSFTCGNNFKFYNAYDIDKIWEEVPEQLIGEWYMDTDKNPDVEEEYTIVEIRADGTLYYMSVVAHSSGHKVDVSAGFDFKVLDGGVYGIKENGLIWQYAYYTVEDGVLRLYRTDYGDEGLIEIELVKGDWNTYLEEHR